MLGRTLLSTNGKPQAGCEVDGNLWLASAPFVGAPFKSGGYLTMSSVSPYWTALASAIAASIIGQALLKGGASGADFVGQLLDWRSFAGLSYRSRRLCSTWWR